MINELAAEMNNKIRETTLYNQLSDLGEKMYFPRGTKKQSAEAEKYAYKYNATEGMAFTRKHPFVLKSVKKYLQDIDTEEIVTYAPILGTASLRELWGKELYRKNKLLENKDFTKPVVTGGLTHGLSIAADLFVDNNSVLIIPNIYWPNYEIIFKERRSCLLVTYNSFKNGMIDIESLEAAIKRIGKGKKIVAIFNFPHNPTGYSPKYSEVLKIKEYIADLADDGYKMTILFDDAYFGLTYEKDVYSESLFPLFADLHENIIAVKIDGASKEYYAWGLRVGFITLASKGFGKEHYDVLENKISGIIRSTISNSSKLSQIILEKIILDKDTEKEKEKYYIDLKNRYCAVKKIIENKKGNTLTAFPFNSGYFMCFDVKNGNAEMLRKHLLEKYGIGTTSIQNKNIRVSFACIDEESIDDLYESIYKASSLIYG